MTYRVLDDQDLKMTDPRRAEGVAAGSGPEQATYAKQVEAACNAMERDGYTLVHVIRDHEPDSANPQLFVFHKSRPLESRPI